MKVNGGVIGSFHPDKKNKQLNHDISYSANIVHYNLTDEITILSDNAKIFYGKTILEGGEIEANLKTNIVTSKIKQSVLPLVKTENEPPTYGDYMEFNLITETGDIRNGYNEIDMGIFRGCLLYTSDAADE